MGVGRRQEQREKWEKGGDGDSPMERETRGGGEGGGRGWREGEGKAPPWANLRPGLAGGGDDLGQHQLGPINLHCTSLGQ